MSRKYGGLAIGGSFALLVSFYPTNASAGFPAVQEWQCGQKDGAPASSVINIAGRLAWGQKCYPDLMEVLSWSQEPEKMFINSLREFGWSIPSLDIPVRNRVLW